MTPKHSYTNYIEKRGIYPKFTSVLVGGPDLRVVAIEEHAEERLQDLTRFERLNQLESVFSLRKLCLGMDDATGWPEIHAWMADAIQIGSLESLQQEHGVLRERL